MPSNDAVGKFSPVVFNSLSQRLLGSLMGHMNIQVEIPKLVEMYEAGELKLDELVSKHYRFEDINEAIATHRQRTVSQVTHPLTTHAEHMPVEKQ